MNSLNSFNPSKGLDYADYMDYAFLSFSSYKRIAFESLHQNKNIVIQKKQTFAIFQSLLIKNTMKHLLSDSTNFEKFNIEENEQIKFILSSGKRLNDIIKTVHGFRNGSVE